MNIDAEEDGCQPTMASTNVPHPAPAAGDEHRANLALADFVAPKASNIIDFVGGFAVTAGIGVSEVVARFEKDHDDYNAIMTKALADRAGIELTENFAMTPAASVSGLYFAHPQSKYFAVGRIGRDQVVEYHTRKDMSLPVVERWLAPALGYEPEAVSDPTVCACGAQHGAVAAR